jgi:Short C-terminal domain
VTLLVLGALGIVTVVASFAFSLAVLVVSRPPHVLPSGGAAPAPAPDAQPQITPETGEAFDETSDPMARVLRDIERLAALREQGALTEKEFAAQKAKLLVTPAAPTRARRPQRTS